LQHRPRVLIVEDDEQLAQAITHDLRLAGYDTSTVHNGVDALGAASQDRFDAVLLDLGLPDLDGLEVMRHLRSDGGPAILAVTGRSSLEDRVDGLYAGADDYLTKPFSMLELRARLHAQLRTRRVSQEALSFGNLKLEPLEHRCRVGETDVPLSSRELELLLVLATRPGRVFSQVELGERIYGGGEPDSNALEVRVASIRRKLREAGLDGVIRTVRGAGYAFSAPN
jgi:DNA-binding response OmpR family regulator